MGFIKASRSRLLGVLILLIFASSITGLLYISFVSRTAANHNLRQHPAAKQNFFSKFFKLFDDGEGSNKGGAASNTARGHRHHIRENHDRHHKHAFSSNDRRQHQHHRHSRGRHGHARHSARHKHLSYHPLFVEDSIDSIMMPGGEYPVEEIDNLQYAALQRNISDEVMFPDVAAENPNVIFGGRYKPANRTPRSKVAIIIPYRHRWHQLRLLLHYLHPVLQRQGLQYGIFVVNQAGNDAFNRASLLNVGYHEVNKVGNYHCFVFHDVDLIPENCRCLYTCSNNVKEPRHISTAISKFGYRHGRRVSIGGVSAFTRRQFEAVNGWSNCFKGWGGENDDMALRLKARKMRIRRPSSLVCRFTSLPHGRDKANPVNRNRFNLLRSFSRRMPSDGLNSIRYKILDTKLYATYTNITVSLQT